MAMNDASFPRALIVFSKPLDLPYKIPCAKSVDIYDFFVSPQKKFNIKTPR